MKNIKNMVKGLLSLALVALGITAEAGQAITLTATSASKVYDGTALAPAGYTVSGSMKTRTIGTIKKKTYTDYVDSVTYSTSGVKDVGSYAYKVSSAVIKGNKSVTSAVESWKDVTSDYDITYADGGTLTITPATITSMTLNEPTTLSYTGKDQTVTVGEVKAGNLTLSPSDYDITGNTASEVGVHTVTVTGKGNYQGTATATWEIKAHTHKWSYATSTEGNVVTLTATCTESGCLLDPPTTSATLTLSSGDKVYDGQAITATLAKGDFETLTGIPLGEVVCTGNATDVGTYKFSVSAEDTGCDFGKSVTISQADIAGKTLTLSPTSTSYTGAGQTVSVTVDGLTKDVDYTISGDALTQIGSGAENKTYTVTVNGIGNYTGSKSATWTIVAPTGSLGSMAAVGNGCSKDGDTAVKVTSSQSLSYDATAKTWSFGLKVDVPNSIPTWEEPTVTYPDNMIITTSCDKVTTSLETDTDSWWTKGYTYVKSVSATAKFTLDDILAAEASGELKFTVSIGAKAGEYNSAGLKEVIYEMIVPIDENLKLLDEDNNQVYPALNYVAQVADTKLKYTTLGAAISAATADQTVNAIAACEKADFTVGANVTVNLAGYGALGATYKLGGDLDNMNAKVMSSKQETVTTDATSLGIETTESEGTYTYSLKYVHVHNWKWASEDGRLYADCQAASCDHSHVEITLTGSDATYDATAHACTLSDTTDFTTHTGYAVGGIVYKKNGEVVESAKDAGSYVAEVTCTKEGAEDKMLTKSFTISQRDISDAVITLSSTSLPYSGAEQTVELSSVTAGGLTVTYTEDTDSVRTANAIGSYTVKITATGNFTGSATKDWSITNYSGSLKSLAMAEDGVGTLEGTTLTVTDSSKLYYDAANQIWYAGLTLTWDWSTKDYTLDYGYAIFTKPSVAQMTVGDTTISGEQSGVYDGCKIDNATGTLTYKKNIGNTKTCTYLNTTTFRVAITPAIIAAAKEAGVITGTMYAGAFPFSESDDTQRSSGIAFQNYTINIPINENLKLYDEVGNQVYPALNYVAQVAETKLKYTTLAAAIGAATADQTVNAIAACEKADFTVGANVTVNLAGYGAAGATYKLNGELDKSMNAKVMSSKAETVTTDATSLGIETTESEGTYTYSLKYVHVHDWKWASEDGRLYADCQAASCDHSHVEITLTGSDATYDATAHACTLSDTTDFTTHTGYAVGGIVYKKNGEVVESATDAGSYVAEVTCTKEGVEDKTLTKSFTISPAEISEMTLSATTLYYMAAEQSVSVTSVKANGVEAKDYVTVSGDTAATAMGTYTVTVTANNANFTGSKSATWEIKNTSGSIGGSAVVGTGIKKESDTFFTLDDSTKLEYGDPDTWWATIRISFSHTKKDWEIGDTDHWAKYTKAEAAKITVDGVTISARDIISAGSKAFQHSIATAAEATDSYRKNLIGETTSFTYLDYIQLKVGFSLGEVQAAAAGTGKLTWVMNLGAMNYDGSQSVEFKDYVVEIPVTGEDFVLFNTNGDQRYPEHIHNWTALGLEGNSVTSACLNAGCAVKVVSVTLDIADKVYDGNAIAGAIVKSEGFDTYYPSTVGTIKYYNAAEAEISAPKYTGEYTAKLAVSDLTIVVPFKITKPAGGYTDGWEVNCTETSVRYDSWTEARDAAQDGDTIYYHEGDRDNTEHNYSIDKNLTIDFGGKTLKQTEEQSWLTADDMVIKNTGSGVLTLQNVTIKQPRTTYSGQIETEGTIVFGDGVKVENTASDSANYCTITVNSGSLIVSNGLYQCGFATKSEDETVNLRAGKYWEHDKPQIGQYSPADRACIEIEGDYKYEIVPHVHHFAYTAEGNVITSVCDGEYKEGCYWYQNPQTATLTANDAAESSEPYAGASVAYTDLWVGSKELAITYWQGETQLAGAPTRFGTYTAKIELEGAVAAKDFTITPMAVTITVPNVANASVVVKEGETVVSSQTEEYSVTHGATITATYTPAEGYVPTNAVVKTIECAEPGSKVDVSEIVFAQAAAMVVPHEGATTNYYATVKEAIEAVPYEGLVTLCRDSEGDGIVIAGDKKFAFDLGGYTYTVTGNPVGPDGDKTLGFQILAGASVDIKNHGTLTSIKGSGVKTLVENAATLLLQNYAKLDGTNLDGEGKVYTLVSNNGFTEIFAAGEVITRGEGDIAVAASTLGSYDKTEVLLDAGKITGDIEVSWYAGTKPEHTVALELQEGIVTGKIVMDKTAEDNEKVRVWNSGAVSVEIPAGYKWNSEGVLVKRSGTVYFIQ